MYSECFIIRTGRGLDNLQASEGCGFTMSTTEATAPGLAELALELRDVHQQIEDVRGQLQRLMFGVHDAGFLWRPEESRWSISECLVHLNVTASLYVSAIDRALKTARPASSPDELPRRGWLGRWMLNTLEPPIKRRFKAPNAFAPDAGKPLDDVVPEFIRYQDEIQKRLLAANRFDLWRTKVKSPAMPLLKFSLGETFAIIAAHERRHLAQADAVKESDGFPRP